jgi:Fe-S-cluster containining protein
LGVVRLRVVSEADERSPSERAQALHQARDGEDARARLAAVLEPLREALARLEAEPRPDAEVWALLDQAYLALDDYLAALLHAAAIDPACGPRCSACCTDLPPILPVEALRALRALRREQPEQAPRRIQRAVDQARAFQQLLLSHSGPQGRLDVTDPSYREAQLNWRRRGMPCPLLGDDGNCSSYAARPLACRVHVHLEDPAHCEPKSPRFLLAERPPLWGHPRECEVEIALVAISKRLGLAGTPNLQWGLAKLHDHPLASG